MAGGLRYQFGRDMPPGMQELYGVLLAGQQKTAAQPVGPEQANQKENETETGEFLFLQRNVNR